MSRQTEEKLQDFYKWWLQNEKDVKSPTTSLDKRVDFLYRMIYNMAWAMTYLIEDIQALEGRQFDKSKIMTPSQLKLDADLRQGGDQRG